MTFTEVSEVASEEPGGCPRTGGSPPERIPSSGGACSIGRRSVLRRQEERAPSRGEVGGSENQAYCLLAVVARKARRKKNHLAPTAYCHGSKTSGTQLKP